METSLVLFFFAIVLWLASREKPLNRPWQLGFALGGLVFARLDHALISLPILAGICAFHVRQPGSLRERSRGPAIATLAFALPIVAYLIVNHVAVGSALPTSGRAKSTFPFITLDNFDAFVKLVNQLLRGNHHYLDQTWRTLQLVVPAAAALASPLFVVRFRMKRGVIVTSLAKQEPRVGALLLLVALGIIALGAYDFLFVYCYGAGHWYVPVSTVFVSLLCLYAAERFRSAWRERRAAKISTPRRAAAARVLRYVIPVGSVTAVALSFVLFWRTPNYHLRYANFAVDEGEALRSFFANKNAKIIDCDDGIVAWVSELPAMSGTGLGLDPEASSAQKGKSGILPLAEKRGFFYAATLIYLDLSQLRGDSPKDILEWMLKMGSFRQLGDLKQYEWNIAYRSANRSFVVFRATPRFALQKPENKTSSP